MVDIDVGSAVAAIGVLFGYVFAVGVLFGAVASYIVHRLWFGKRNFHKSLRFYLISICTSIVFGYLAIQSVLWWNTYEQLKYNEREKRFVKEMRSEYRLTGIKELYRGGLELTLWVPRDSLYYVVWTIGTRDHEFDKSIPSFATDQNQYYVSEYDYKYHRDIHFLSGENTFVVYSEKLMRDKSIKDIDLTVQIFPETAGQTFVNDLRGIAVSNSGAIEYSEGIAYQSSSIFRGDCNASHLSRLPCVDTSLLHIKPTK